MTPEEKFMFDLEGYIVIKNVLTPEEVKKMNAFADTTFPDGFPENGTNRTSQISKWGPDFQALLDHPNVMPYLVELLGPKVRVDHDYCIFMKKNATRGSLHGGETDLEGDHWYKYRDGAMRNGLTVATFFLSPAKKGDGGFCCIPGSHKSNFIFSLPRDVRTFERKPHYVVQPEVEAGDVLIFTEALIHGTMAWTADHERRALLYKYSPGHSAWSKSYYNPEDYPNITDQQRRLMAAPCVGSRPNTVENAA
ncbi:MAG: phytanoyl-CoA dioxygenase family protein [bacterium]|nr:phytanoyl-CoA dioxygenase family protein [bacterium]